MTNKRISNVPNPLGSSHEDQVSAIRNLIRSQDKINKLRIMGLDKNKIGQTSKQMEQEVSNRQKYLKQVIPQAPDKLSGRTPDAGTKSLLQGFKSFIKGGQGGGGSAEGGRGSRGGGGRLFGTK